MRVSICGLVAGREQRRIEGCLFADMALEQPPAVVFGQTRASMKRIEDQRRESHQKMAREVDAVDVEPGAAGDFHVDDGQRDRNAGAPFDHLVQETVARIVVPLAVSREPFFVEQICIQYVDGRFGLAQVLQAPARREAFVARRLPSCRAARDTASGSSAGHSSLAIINAGVARS